MLLYRVGVVTHRAQRKTLLAQQLLFGCSELLEFVCTHLRIRQIQIDKGVDHCCTDYNAGKPFVICRHHIPWPSFSAGVRFGREIVGMVDRAERGLNGFNYRYEGRGAGVGRDLGAGVPLGVGVGLGVELGVGVGDGVLDGVDVAIGVDVGVAVELAVAVGLGVGVGDGVAVGVRVGVGVGP